MLELEVRLWSLRNLKIFSVRKISLPEFNTHALA